MPKKLTGYVWKTVWIRLLQRGFRKKFNCDYNQRRTTQSYMDSYLVLSQERVDKIQTKIITSIRPINQFSL